MTLNLDFSSYDYLNSAFLTASSISATNIYINAGSITNYSGNLEDLASITLVRASSISGTVSVCSTWGTTSGDCTAGSGMTSDTTIGSTITASTTITNNGGTISANVSNFSVKEGARVIPQSNLASLASLALSLQGADLASQAIAYASNAISQVKQAMTNDYRARMFDTFNFRQVGAARAKVDAKKNAFVPFGVIQGAYNDYSGVGLSTISGYLLAGFAINKGVSTTALFFDAGVGMYDTSLSISDGSSYAGSGNAYYMGGGLSERFNISVDNYNRIYLELSARGGVIANTYANKNLSDGNGTAGGYDNESTYYLGGHAGIGYIHDIGKKTRGGKKQSVASVDLYAKYLLNYQAGYDINLTTADPVSFDDITSQRIRAGLRVVGVDPNLKPYIGAYWEMELTAMAKATTYGLDILSVDNLKGHTYVGELGILISASRMPLSLNGSLQGYGGKRVGANAMLTLRYSF